MKRALLVSIILTISAILLSSSVKAQIDYNIVGRWRPFNTTETITFYQNGDIEYENLQGTYDYNGERLILNLKRGEKYRSITSFNAYIDDDKLYLAYTGKGYLVGSKHNKGLVGEWEAYRRFTLINSKTGYPYEDRFEHLILRFWEGVLYVTQGYDTYQERTTQYSYGVEYDEIADRYYFYRLSHPSDRTYYEIVDLNERKLLLLSHDYLLEGDETVSVTFNYPYYERLP
jgi:hypothetical protein